MAPQDGLELVAAKREQDLLELGWVIEHSKPGDDRELLVALHAPLLALLDRYPPRAKTTTEEVEVEGATDGDDEPAST